MPDTTTLPMQSLANQPLLGQTALVTGSSSGIGKGVALALARAGADVAVNYSSNPNGAQGVVDAIEMLGRRSVAIGANVAEEAAVESMFERTLDALGRLDIVVSNAGLQRDAPIDQMQLADWKQVIDVNLTGQFLVMRAAVRAFKRRPASESRSHSAGKIVCVSSVHEVIPWAGHANYAASKGGVMMLMKTLAQELAPHRIRVNSVCPGAIRTPINRSAWETPEAYESLLELIPIGRIGEPDDVGRAVSWLVSDQADYVTGLNLYVDGGMTLYPGFAAGG
ncbi:MAG TPA: glucose 1-dehydrogenase [Polyangiales bacterium]|nr:glucose 1-dehydrogenase [Polyangiales bacterium]